VRNLAWLDKRGMHVLGYNCIVPSGLSKLLCSLVWWNYINTWQLAPIF